MSRTGNSKSEYCLIILFRTDFCKEFIVHIYLNVDLGAKCPLFQNIIVILGNSNCKNMNNYMPGHSKIKAFPRLGGGLN